ncbi:antitoxin [Actinomadura sp. ATCC 31491]|uniref:Antitoxin n=1 Tax=Actinomadura luzonensis TaxID=2805427 RepID=A0ABT0FIV1_9ACTN|nr:antitoxin [Actinomadura luzonensis]MCK2212222.1 antitoxin [Actinomadura luzonensis]
MSRIGEWLKKAENLARGHSKQADQVLDRASRFAKERTGHKYDEHIEKGRDAVQRRYGGGGGTSGERMRQTDRTAAERERLSPESDPTAAERERYGRGPQG